MSKSRSTNQFMKRESFKNNITVDSIGAVSQADLEALPLICPYGIQEGKDAKNILFIHGTGATGDVLWKGGFPEAFQTKGYSSCWINLPGRSLEDAQLSGEYVAHSIKKLYTSSQNTPIFLIGHSQGNLNIQWALNFFPSNRDRVSSYIALAGDFQGAHQAQLLIAANHVLREGSAPSILQQSVTLGKPSKFLDALHKHGNMPLVPTSSTYGIMDQVLQPVWMATDLPHKGAAFTHVSIQSICPIVFADHFCIVVNKVAFYLALDAFEHGTAADVGRVRRDFVDLCIGNPLAPMMSLTSLYDNAIKPLGISTISILTPSANIDAIRTKEEPALLPYAANQL